MSLCILNHVVAVVQGLGKGMQEIPIKWVTLSSEIVAIRHLLKELDTAEVDKVQRIFTIQLVCSLASKINFIWLQMQQRCYLVRLTITDSAQISKQWPSH